MDFYCPTVKATIEKLNINESSCDFLFGILLTEAKR